MACQMWTAGRQEKLTAEGAEKKNQVDGLDNLQIVYPQYKADGRHHDAKGTKEMQLKGKKNNKLAKF